LPPPSLSPLEFPWSAAIRRGTGLQGQVLEQGGAVGFLTQQHAPDQRTQGTVCLQGRCEEKRWVDHETKVTKEQQII